MSNAVIQTNVCAICGATDISDLIIKHDISYAKCVRCRVLRHHPYPSAEQISAYYTHYQSLKSAGSIYLSDDGYSVFCRDKKLTFADLGIKLSDFNNKQVLDVGCATGQFLQMMQDAGATNVMGLDASAECINIAKSKGLNCQNQEFLDHQQQYHVISMWHLIEHVMDPIAYLHKAYELLLPGGWLLIETPVTGELSTAFGSDWRYLMPIEHLHLFPFDTLVQLTNQAGFALQRFTRFGSGNDSGTVSQPNKGAMDRFAKSTGSGDTLAMWLIKPNQQAEK
ncbi:class I SAM-dependent methyltransferase [Alishewanella sp. 16-MA]|uniref:Class I SAM-dependent methyltransferase n=1 Tax=Alishewanella maricola TaxID=2795740 RepID=A0ABS8C5Y9_9ALTE|nr:class I SAM-dependent methyltransferase [Alishewanella maricola]MCB5227754.1 class I SAM-dependent methyltransferase [Alishewanella maricola]